MKNLWNPDDAVLCTDDLSLRVYSSRLLGLQPELVLHGGGNTSVKIRETNLLGDEEDILYVKGSGWDLASIEREGFAPVRMEHLLRLAGLPTLSDAAMVNELKTHMTLALAPTPSVETILHAVLPYRFVDHTHADAVISVTNTEDGEQRIREIYADAVIIIPYAMPGFELARLVASEIPKVEREHTLGMVLMNHGIFSFGDSAEESYARMIDLVTKAEEYLDQRSAWHLASASPPASPGSVRLPTAHLRSEISRATGSPMVMSCHRDAAALAFARHPDAARISQQGPATPDHIIRTKRLPMLGRDVPAYTAEYRRYFDAQARGSKAPLSMLDSAPRVVLDPELGLCALGHNGKDAQINADIYRHTMSIIRRSEKLGGYRALPAADLFDVEYWELEQAKLRKGGSPRLFAGEVALVTGAASGIGKACVDSLLRRGAAVVGLDVNREIIGLHRRPDYAGIVCDLTDEASFQTALEQAIEKFGGLDILVLNAGIFEAGTPIADLSGDAWQKTMRINLDANMLLLRECHPLLKLAPRGGRVAVIGSKNVPAPGPGAAAYSASKAALNQLVRVAALEWAGDGIRLNSLHPDAVFDTGIWTEEVLQARARHYGMTVREYKTKNLLGVEINSRDVAELAAELCGPLFGKTTAAQIPVDGGNDRVI